MLDVEAERDETLNFAETVGDASNDDCEVIL